MSRVLSDARMRLPIISMWARPELVEAAARTGNAALAGDALNQLSEWTRTRRSDWGLGVEARPRALLSDGEAADRLYREAIARLGRTGRRAVGSAAGPGPPVLRLLPRSGTESSPGPGCSDGSNSSAAQPPDNPVNLQQRRLTSSGFRGRIDVARLESTATPGWQGPQPRVLAAQ